jgi:hypothetical protein
VHTFLANLIRVKNLIYLLSSLLLLRSGEAGGCPAAAPFFSINCGLALSGGFSPTLVCVCASMAADAEPDDELDDVRASFFFSVHWFCLAKRSAAVMSGLSGPECTGLVAGDASPNSSEVPDGDTLLLLLSGRSITRSGVCFCCSGSPKKCGAGGGAGLLDDDSEFSRLRQISRLWWNELLLLLPLLPLLPELLTLHRSASMSLNCNYFNTCSVIFKRSQKMMTFREKVFAWLKINIICLFFLNIECDKVERDRRFEICCYISALTIIIAKFSICKMAKKALAKTPNFL